ncbi:unnamed protein product, partial [Mesorhabditis belari]|uniref:Saposin B-type domain-containing protein n=1 Tax=Mesorhabditis belari TaxID=2138241 RepID=A0AAF3JC88_9BILA
MLKLGFLLVIFSSFILSVDSTTCEDCEVAIEAVVSYFEDFENVTVDEVIAHFDDLCEAYGQEMDAATCKKRNQANRPGTEKMLSLLKKKVSHREICAQLGCH